MYGGGKNQSVENIIKSISNPFKLRKENEAIKGRVIGYIRTLFKQEDDCYKPIRVGNFWNNYYIEYESNDDRNQNLSVKEYLAKNKPFLRDVILILKNPIHGKFS